MDCADKTAAKLENSTKRKKSDTFPPNVPNCLVKSSTRGGDADEGCRMTGTELYANYDSRLTWNPPRVQSKLFIDSFQPTSARGSSVNGYVQLGLRTSRGAER